MNKQFASINFTVLEKLLIKTPNYTRILLFIIMNTDVKTMICYLTEEELSKQFKMSVHNIHNYITQYRTAKYISQEGYYNKLNPEILDIRIVE